jgi:hypothetical protein
MESLDPFAPAKKISSSTSSQAPYVVLSSRSPYLLQVLISAIAAKAFKSMERKFFNPILPS